jgi:transposase InsO family protein
VSHANARTTLYARKLLVDRVRAGHRPAEVAKQLGVSRQTVYKWVRRFRAEGEAGLRDRSSRPLRPARLTTPEVVTAICHARLAEHAGPVRLAALLGLPASTIGEVLRRSGMPRLADVDRLTGELLRARKHSEIRFEHDRPGSLLHIDVKKLGRIPDGGGWRVHGRTIDVGRHSKLGWDFVHVAIDDHSRLAYAEVLPDETGPTCAAFLHRAVAWFRAHGVVVRRLLTDNAKAYRVERTWAAVCSALQLKRRFTKPGHPWTNGKAERFNRTLQTEWAYARPWTSNGERTAALDSFLQHYNTARGHSALGGHPPISRLTA